MALEAVSTPWRRAAHSILSIVYRSVSKFDAFCPLQCHGWQRLPGAIADRHARRGPYRARWPSHPRWSGAPGAALTYNGGSTDRRPSVHSTDRHSAPAATAIIITTKAACCLLIALLRSSVPTPLAVVPSISGRREHTCDLRRWRRDPRGRGASGRPLRAPRY